MAVVVLVLALALTCALALAAVPAQAHPSDMRNTSGYTLTLKPANGPSFTYGQSDAPILTGTLTVPAGASVQTDAFSVEVDGTNMPGALAQTTPTTYTYTIDTYWSELSAGTFTAVATYSSVTDNNNAQSSPLTFQIARVKTSLDCSIAYTAGNVFQPGATISVSPNSNAVPAPSGSPDGTYTISFTGGPRDVTYTNLVPDSNSIVSVAAPTQYGDYHMSCAYSGNANTMPAQGNTELVIISREQSLTGASLYTNPTTLHVGQPWEAYVVLHGQPGGPAPTGTLTITMMNCYEQVVTIGANGDTLARLPGGQCPVENGMYVVYSGDGYYNSTYYSFTQTNPGIPASILSSAPALGGMSPAQATPTSGSAAPPTQGRTAAWGGAPESAHTVGAVTAHESSSTVLLGVVAGVGLLIVCGGVCAAVIRSRRARA